MTDHSAIAPLSLERNGRLRIAIVHDWLTGMRGGERTLEVLCQLFPRADLFTLVHVPGSVTPAIERHPLHRSFIQRLPLAGRLYRHYLPLFPTAIEQFDLDGFDLVISASHCAAKSVVAPGRARHLCYCFTPMRYAWDQFDAYFGAARLGGASRAARAVLSHLARWDADTSGRPDRYVAISQHVARRIRRYYNREASVVYPPVDTDFYHPGEQPIEAFCLVVSALVPYKRIDLAIAACRESRTPLKIVGQGPERARLERLAGPGVELLGAQPDEVVRDLYRRATAVLLPGEEDFGIVPVEAQACGRPVVALAAGGALETVIDGETGILVAGSSTEAFAAALDRVRRTTFDPAVIRGRALRFSRERFARQIAECLEQLLDEGGAIEDQPWSSAGTAS